MATEEKKLSEEEQERKEFLDLLRMIPGLENASDERLGELWCQAMEENEKKQQEKKKRRRKILGILFGIAIFILGFFFSRWLFVIGICIILITLLKPANH